MIEVLLFLSISGLMMAGVLVGIGDSINRQRYTEATTSFLDYMQSQYSLVDNVRNNRPDDRACTTSGIGTGSDGGRGTSSCIVVGRLIESINGQSVQSRPVYATVDVESDDLSEADYLDALRLQPAPDDLTTDDGNYELAWQTTVYTDPANPDASRHFALLILRLPTNGLTRTYVATSVTDISDFWKKSTLTEVNLCVEPSGLIGRAPATGVRILEGAANSTGVQAIAAGDGSC